MEQITQQQVQQQQQQQQQQIQQQQQQASKLVEQVEVNWDINLLLNPDTKDILPSFVVPLKNLAANNIWEQYNFCMDENLLASENFLKTAKDQVNLYNDSAKKTVYEFFFLRNSDKDPWKAVMISTKKPQL